MLGALQENSDFDVIAGASKASSSVHASIIELFQEEADTDEFAAVAEAITTVVRTQLGCELERRKIKPGHEDGSKETQ